MKKQKKKNKKKKTKKPAPGLGADPGALELWVPCTIGLKPPYHKRVPQ